ncbi:MAG: hypothetical protein ACHQO8_05615 [Vicinamibacterales bacterium]
MNDSELRALVRDAVRRHLGDHAAPAPDPALPVLTETPWSHHASHAQYLTIVNVGDRCVIEPDVNCNHCGYCKSHGH